MGSSVSTTNTTESKKSPVLAEHGIYRKICDALLRVLYASENLPNFTKEKMDAFMAILDQKDCAVSFARRAASAKNISHQAEYETSCDKQLKNILNSLEHVFSYKSLPRYGETKSLPNDALYFKLLETSSVSESAKRLAAGAHNRARSQLDESSMKDLVYADSSIKLRTLIRNEVYSIHTLKGLSTDTPVE